MKSDDITLTWLLRLRWAAVTGQTATIVFCVDALGISLPLGMLVTVILLTVATQVVLWSRSGGIERPRPSLIGGVIVLDILLLTAMLFLTGGPHNPFSAFYLIHIAMAASLLGQRWTWALLGLAMGCFGGLFWGNIPLPLSARTEAVCGLAPPQLHLAGMFVALGLTGLCLAWFVARLNSQLREQELALHAAEMRAERESRFAALATLAAGVAHEISSPLATIAVAARELELEAGRPTDTNTLADDARLIRIEVERCREILGRLRAHAGGDPHDPPVDWRLDAFTQTLLEALPPAQAPRVTFETADPQTRFRAPRIALLQSLGNLISNAVEASRTEDPVHVEIERTERGVSFTVRDHGPGLPESVAARLGEPFVTTKEPGKGTGLGLFLVRRFADQMGGAFEIASCRDGGTQARLDLPQRALT